MNNTPEEVVAKNPDRRYLKTVTMVTEYYVLPEDATADDYGDIWGLNEPFYTEQDVTSFDVVESLPGDDL